MIFWQFISPPVEDGRILAYLLLKKVCLGLGISEQDFSDFMDYQIMTDFLMSNTDRHMNNIAIMRNPDTLQILGFAPIYDSGNSMFYNVPYENLNQVRLDDIRTHSFIEKEVKLLQYVRNRTLVDIDKAEMDFAIYKKDVVERHIRIPMLKELYERKREKLRIFQNGKDIWKNSNYREHS